MRFFQKQQEHLYRTKKDNARWLDYALIEYDGNIFKLPAEYKRLTLS